MKEEITIPPQYSQIIKAEAERRNISIEDVGYFNFRVDKCKLF